MSRLENGGKGSGIERLDTLEIVCSELGIEVWELLKPEEASESSTADDQE